MKVEARIKRSNVIRRVTRIGQDGRPKVATDRRTRTTMERVRAQVQKRCCYRDCLLGLDYVGYITPGTEHAVITRRGVYANFGRFPENKAYHFGCVPPEARPLVRFFKQ